MLVLLPHHVAHRLLVRLSAAYPPAGRQQCTVAQAMFVEPFATLFGQTKDRQCLFTFRATASAHIAVFALEVHGCSAAAVMLCTS